MTTTISFELATSLKEKGFDEKVKGRYCIKNITPFKVGLFYLSDYELTDEFIYGPTIAETIMWLYEKHSIWIAVNRVVIGSDEWDYGYIISYLPKEYEFEKRRSKHLVEIQSFKEGVGSYHGAWYTPTEAYEAAIEYTLKNLI